MRIAVVGNCHGNIVAQAVRAALHDVPSVDCRHIVSYESASDADRSFVDAADRVLLQVADFKSRGSFAQQIDTASDRVGLFPLIAANFMYPFAGKSHPLAAGSRSFFCPSGYYERQISDSALVDLMDKHAAEPAEAIVERYLGLDYAELVDLDRLYEINRVKMQRIGEAAGLDLWSKVARCFRDTPVFWTYLHPSGSLLRELCKHSLRQLRLGLDKPTIDAAIDKIREPLGFAHMPIHPSVVRHFGLEWADLDYRYRFMPEGSLTIRDFALRFVRFEHDDELTRAIFNLHSDLALDEALTSLQQARSKYPLSGDVLINLAIAYWKHGRLPQAVEAAVSALEIDPAQDEWAAFLCIIVRQTGIAGTPDT